MTTKPPLRSIAPGSKKKSWWKGLVKVLIEAAAGWGMAKIEKKLGGSNDQKVRPFHKKE